MSTSEPKSGERVRDVRVTDDAISVDLFDGRTITIPLAWYPRLLHATPEESNQWGQVLPCNFFSLSALFTALLTVA